MIVHSNNGKVLIDFIREREAIRVRKEVDKKPPPWTKDQILRDYRFCNVRRRDDRVSRWLLKNVLNETIFNKIGIVPFVYFTALCRFVNWPPTIAVLMKKGFFPVKRLDLSAIGDHIDEMVGKVWTGAYMVRAEPGSKIGKGAHIATEVIRDGLTPIMDDLCNEFSLQGGTRQSRVCSRRVVHEKLMTRRCWGSFMAGQVVDDWAMVPALLGRASDNKTWAPLGPGSQRGLNRIQGIDLDTKWKDDAFCDCLGILRKEIIRELGPTYEDLTLHDVQNCLCELDKYLRAKNNEGRPRSNYKPETAY